MADHHDSDLPAAVAAELSVGDDIMVMWQANDDFISTLEMDLIPGCKPVINSGPCNSWDGRQYNIQFRRVVTAITGNTITIDLPLATAFTQEYSPSSTVWKYDDPNLIVLSGVRDISIISQYSDGPEDETHAWSAVYFEEVKHGFAQNLKCHQFGMFCGETRARNPTMTCLDVHARFFSIEVRFGV